MENKQQTRDKQQNTLLILASALNRFHQFLQIEKRYAIHHVQNDVPQLSHLLTNEIDLSQCFDYMTTDIAHNQ